MDFIFNFDEGIIALDYLSLHNKDAVSQIIDFVDKDNTNSILKIINKYLNGKLKKNEIEYILRIYTIFEAYLYSNNRYNISQSSKEDLDIKKAMFKNKDAFNSIIINNIINKLKNANMDFNKIINIYLNINEEFKRAPNKKGFDLLLYSFSKIDNYDFSKYRECLNFIQKKFYDAKEGKHFFEALIRNDDFFYFESDVESFLKEESEIDHKKSSIDTIVSNCNIDQVESFSFRIDNLLINKLVNVKLDGAKSKVKELKKSGVSMEDAGWNTDYTLETIDTIRAKNLFAFMLYDSLKAKEVDFETRTLSYCRIVFKCKEKPGKSYYKYYKNKEIDLNYIKDVLDNNDFLFYFDDNAYLLYYSEYDDFVCIKKN